MVVSSLRCVATVWWAASLGLVVATNSHGPPLPVPAPSNAEGSAGSHIPATRAVITAPFPSSQTQSLTLPRPQERGQSGASRELTVLSPRLSEGSGAHHHLSALTKYLAHGTYENKVMLVWKKALSDTARGAESVARWGSQALATEEEVAVEVRSCDTDSLHERLRVLSKLAPSDAPHRQTFVILLCRQTNMTGVVERVRRATSVEDGRGEGEGGREKGKLIIFSFVKGNKHERSARWEEFQEGNENGELSRVSRSYSYLRPMSSDPRSLPPTDLQGKILKVSAVDNWPFFGLRKGVGGRVEADAGIDVSILNTLSQTLNFTYEVVLEEGGQWGGPQADGTVTGMIGMVARGEAHLAINEITITAARETVVDFTRPYFMESSACTSPAPKERSRAFAVLSPFTLQVWVSVGVSVMAVGLVLWVVSALTSHYHEKPTVTPLHELTFNMYRSLVVQSNRLPALLWPLRLVFAGWYLYCFYVSALYSGTLTAVLALPVYEKPIDSLADLLEASKQGFYPVTIKEISIDFLFQKATSGVYHQIGRLMTTDKHYVDSPSNGIARVLQGPAVYIDARLSMEIQMIVQGRDNFYLGRQSFFPQTYGIACMKGADYRRHFDRVLERLVQSGLVEKYKRDEFLKLGGRITGVGSKRRGQTSAITITHLQGAFFLYVIGVTLALAVLVMERIVWQRFLK